MHDSKLRFTVGTRASPLALAQTRGALQKLSALVSGLTFEEKAFSSPGDRDRATDLRTSPGDFFTRDLDAAVLGGEIDGAVHSAKDLPEPVPDGLDWCWLPWREDPRDALVLAPGRAPAGLAPDARFGVSSERREAWCRRRFPAARLMPIRGNIEERLAQLDAGHYDALLMAGAALNRLGLRDRITEWIPLTELTPPEGQGVLALTFRSGDPRWLCLRSLWVKAVTFVSAGTSAGTCTLAGLDALQTCDVCLYDSLLDAALLEALPPGAARVDVGKRCGHHSVSQDRITEMLTLYARKGQRTVRLKGGDAGLFGRLAEEIDALDALQLPYRVIPGVSSLNAATTGTGMLLTRRGVSRGFCAMSPRLAEGAVGAMDRAARGKLPLVFFMSTGIVEEVARQLCADGTDADTPAALVFSAGTDSERIVRGTLADIGARAAVEQEGPVPDAPGLLLVGAVTRYTFSRQWGALAGRRVLLTASDALQAKAIAGVHDHGGLPVSRPLIRLVPTPEAQSSLRRLAAFDWVILTSPSAVRCFGTSLREAGVDNRSVPRLMTCGPGTEHELRLLGFIPDATAEYNFGATGLLAAAARHIQAPQRVLRLRSEKAGAAIVTELQKHGITVDDCILYRNEPIHYETLPEFDTVFFASASAVKAFIDLWGARALTGKTVAAIGEPTHAALREAGVMEVVKGAEATVESCLSALAVQCVRQRLAIVR